LSTGDASWQELRQRLLAAGILAELGGSGVFAFGGEFTRVFDALDGRYVATFAGLDAEVWRFPSVEPKPVFERTGYVASFPQLTGTIGVFTGGTAEHAELLRLRAEDGVWEHLMEPGGLMMTPAACHPLYAVMGSPLPEGGRNYDVLGSCFRHEPSPDPMRMQTFRMHEFVHAGTAASALAHRDAARPLLLGLLSSLGLEVADVPANDPFFGRPGKILASNQRHLALKFELVTPVYGDAAPPTAIASANYHDDHFGSAFGIADAAGGVAHTSCVGLGMERTVLALFALHGMSVADWPGSVRSALWPADA
jgi:seryl-tRNA synthetase